MVHSQSLWAPPPWFLGQIYNTRQTFPLVEQALNPPRKWLIDGPYNIPVTYGAYEYVLPGLLFVALSIHSELRP